LFAVRKSHRLSKEISTIFARYTNNGNGPGNPARDPRNESGEASVDLFFDAGRVRTVQKDSTVLALYQSKAQFLDDYRVLRLVLTVPVFYRDLRHVTIGDRSESSSTQADRMD
jgi:hypothetical protein